jgi:hypothetical protein
MDQYGRQYFTLKTGTVPLDEENVEYIHPAIVRVHGRGLERKMGLSGGALLIRNDAQDVWHVVGPVYQGLFISLHQAGNYGSGLTEGLSDGTLQRLRAVLSSYPWLAAMAINPLKGEDNRAVVDRQFDELLRLLGRDRQGLERSAYTFTEKARAVTGEERARQLEHAKGSVEDRITEIVATLIPRLDSRRLTLLAQIEAQMSCIHLSRSVMSELLARWNTDGVRWKVEVLPAVLQACLDLTADLDQLVDIPFRHLGFRWQKDLDFCREHLASDPVLAMERFALAYEAAGLYDYLMEMVAIREQLILARKTRGNRRIQHRQQALAQLESLEARLRIAQPLDQRLRGTRPVGHALRQVRKALHFVEAEKPDLQQACLCLDFAMERF